MRDDLPAVHSIGDILKPDRREVLIRRDRKLRDRRLVQDRQVGHGRRKVQRLQNAAVGQFQTGDGCAVEVDMLQIAAAGEVNGLCQVGAIAHIDSPQQFIVTEVQLGHVTVGVCLGRIAKFQPLELERLGEICVADHQAGQVTHVRQLGSAVDINLSVVYVVQRARQCAWIVSRGSRLNQIGAVLDAGVHVGIRRDGDVRLCIAADCDNIRQAVTGVVL